MSTLHKFKAYFGMVPLEDYEDDYLEEPGRRPARAYDDDRQSGYRSYPEPTYKNRRPEPVTRRDEFASGRDDFGDEEDYTPARGREPETRARVSSISPRGGQASSGRGSIPALHGTTRGALAVDPAAEERRMEERRSVPVDDGGPLSRITTLRPRDYSEARTIGERFRDGTPVIMDLVEMSNADAKRLVDFAAGLAFALRGSFDKVATKVFLLSPADVDVSAAERRRIAEKGFYS